MTSKFWTNVSTYLYKQGKSQKWLAEASAVGKTVINSGIARRSSPSADNAYAIAKVLEVSIEELLDENAGAEYVRRIVRNDPRAIQVPDNIFPIVECLLVLDEINLKGILANVKALTVEGTEKKKNVPKTDGVATELAG